MKKSYIKEILLSLALVLFTACGSSNTGNDTVDTAIDKIVAYAESGGNPPAPTLQDYLDAGVTGVTDVDAINTYILDLTKEDVDTTPEIQAIANELGVTLTGNIPPIAKANGAPITVTEGEEVKLNATNSTDTDGTIVSYRWTDGGVVLARVPSFTKSNFSVGTHTIRLTVTDDGGATDYDTVTITVESAAQTPTPEPEPEPDPEPDPSACLEAAAAGYGTVTLSNGQIWLDKNLGAPEVGDAGDLYQWGRGTEGHEKRTSLTTTGVNGGGGGNHATTLDPNTGADWDGLFITEGHNGTAFDWVNNSVDPDGSIRANLWGTPSSASNLNQVCPCGFVVSSVNDIDTMQQVDYSALNFPNTTGVRLYADGSIVQLGDAVYWYSDTTITGAKLFYADNGVITNTNLSDNRMYGLAVRCIDPLSRP